ncbi:MAG: FAD-binding oxidoreductase, partial [Deltaproteobacteria bacterium]|nr:FAD-binding oxidoreductase [Deltaproteobacteria bacterium]
MPDQSNTEPFEPRTTGGARQDARHAQRVARVAEQLRNRKSTAPLSRRKRVVSHMVPKVHDKKYSDDKIDLFDFDQVIEIDP